MNKVVRFSTKAKTLRGKISTYEKNWKKAKKSIEEGKIICLTDLMAQAEDIYLTRREKAQKIRDAKHKLHDSERS